MGATRRLACRSVSPAQLEPLMFDLKDEAEGGMGPHGMISMTGSGRVAGFDVDSVVAVDPTSAGIVRHLRQASRQEPAPTVEISRR